MMQSLSDECSKLEGALKHDDTLQTLSDTSVLLENYAQLFYSLGFVFSEMQVNMYAVTTDSGRTPKEK